MAEYRELKCPYGDDFEGGDECSRCELYELCMESYPPTNLIEIPENATNGDMLLTIFDTATVYGIDKEEDCITICLDNNFYQKFRYSWWNEQYERGLEQ